MQKSPKPIAVGRFAQKFAALPIHAQPPGTPLIPCLPIRHEHPFLISSGDRHHAARCLHDQFFRGFRENSGGGADLFRLLSGGLWLRLSRSDRLDSRRVTPPPTSDSGPVAFLRPGFCPRSLLLARKHHAHRTRPGHPDK